MNSGRPRLMLDTEPMAQPQRAFEPTPVSPERCFLSVTAERHTDEGKIYKVVWRESWVHEDRLPDMELVKDYHFRQHGTHWEVLSPVMVNRGH
jgi:hypothetical protein